jgi:prepilin-type N-terminal cleavage/methylation domain-containing protein
MAPALPKGMLTRSRHSDRALRAGFSLIEMLVTVAMLAIMVGMAAPNVSKDISHSRVNGAAQVVAGDLEQALSLAGRQRRPVRVVVDGSLKEIRLIDRVSGQLISRRHLGDVSEYKLYSVSGSPSTVDLLPHGVATAPTIVTLSAAGYSRSVTMTRGGHVRVGP